MDFDRIKNISFTGWALVVAGAAFGGAVLHQSRVVGGLMVGGLAFAYAYSEAPCCAGCAGKATNCAGTATNTSAQPAGSVTLGVQTLSSTGAIVAADPRSSRPLATDHIGTAGPAATNPLDIWNAPTYSGPGGPASNGDASSGCKGCS